MNLLYNIKIVKMKIKLTIKKSYISRWIHFKNVVVNVMISGVTGKDHWNSEIGNVC